MTKLNSYGGNAALSVGHMAGLVDLAALPLWVGALMEFYKLQPPQAGLTVTLFLGGVVVASAALAPRFNRLRHRLVAFGGFALSAIAFLITSRLPVSADSFQSFLLLHVIAGLGTGAALSVTHGCIGRTTNPHRLYGIANVALGVLGILMFATLPEMIGKFGGQTLFVAFAATMGFASIVSLLFFPELGAEETAEQAGRQRAPIPLAAWLLIGVVICLNLSQSTVFSFVERIGAAREFGEDRVRMVLIVTGFVSLLPGILAGLLQKRLSPIAVGIAGPVLQAVFALSLTSAVSFLFYAVPAVLYVSLVIFTHTFLFGLLSKVDSSGRSVAATPAMMMSGSATGPFLGGLVVAGVGYHGIGWVIVVIACIAVGLMLRVRRELAKDSKEPELARA